MKIKICLTKEYEKYKVNKLKKIEKIKMQDRRRKNIYSKVNLSKQNQNEIKKIYKENYGKTISMKWHQYYTAYTGKFDVNYFPELLYIPEFEHYMNYNSSLANVLEDKNILPIFANYLKVKMPRKIISCQEGLFKDENENILNYEQVIKKLNSIGECFAKPSIGTDSGLGCLAINIKNGIDIKTNESVEKILKNLGNNFIIQEKIVCSNSIRKLYSESVNTFRIMTYRWKDKIYTSPIIMRIGQNGAFVDNAHAGGMFIALDNNGILHETAFTEFKKEYKKHPNSNIEFKNYKINSVDKVIDSAIKMHYLVPTIGVINWDMTIDENENPVLIEANVNGGSIWLFQMAHGCGAFGDLTPEILKWLQKKEKGNESYFGK